ncbi:three-Cys-motif partner protein TcmP [Saccharothrix hoggarensis]|uniref:Three-Cys-motif partner protein TcmP n=1 Tax=Saccharothrix hoggarensis TaxID=913853 RepID=A0ABW3QW65_9PSEU
MPVKGRVPWAIVEHTLAKHDIYRRYLERWFPILIGGSNAYPSATYAEGFAGPGVYADGEPGSPIIALEAYVKKVPTTRSLAKFLFIDDDPRCVSMLREQLTERFPERPRPLDRMWVDVVQGKCGELLEQYLTERGCWGQPILAVLDSWGNAPVPHPLLRRLARNPATEVIVTFGTQHFVRFVEQLGADADGVFGGDQRWRQVRGLPDGEAKRRHLLDCYRRSLHDAGFQHLLDFELIDRRGEPLYLVFGTNHPRGVEKMKDTLWEVDPVQGVGFRDPRDEQHETLFDVNEPLLAPLARLLVPVIEAGGEDGVAVQDLKDFALRETVYRMQHVSPALQPLLEKGVIRSDPVNRIRTRGRVWAKAG